MADGKDSRYATRDERPIDHTQPIPAINARYQRRFASERPAPQPHYLVVKGLSAGPYRQPIFHGVSLRARLGDLVAVLGNSGTGRTALLLALAGRAHYRGRVTIGGNDTRHRIRQRVTIAQAPPVIKGDPYLTVKGLIEETRLIAPDTCDIDAIMKVCRLLGVQSDAKDRFGKLPTVDQTLLMIACAAAQRTPVIVVDDVDKGVDACGAAKVWQALRTLADRNHLVIASAVRPDLTPDLVVRMRPTTPNWRPTASQDATVIVTRVDGGNTP